jgi:hypothetical protein
VVLALFRYVWIFNFIDTKLEGETAPSVKVRIYDFFLSALHGQPLALDPTPSTSEPTGTLIMGLSGLEGGSGTFEKRNPPVYAGNSTVDRLNPSLRTISTELSWLPYEDFISIAYCTNENSELIQLQQNRLASFNFLHALIHL